MDSFANFDRVQHQRDIDAAVKAAAIQQMASKPKRQAFVGNGLCAEKSPDAAGKPVDAFQVTAPQTQTGKAEGRKVVVGLTEQPGGLRPVSVDGKLVGHAQKVPEGTMAKDIGFTWAFKAETADDLEYFESLAEIRAYALSLAA